MFCYSAPAHYLLDWAHLAHQDVTTSEFNFATQSAIFEKPEDSVNHLKPLHVKGYINGKLVNNMLVDNGAMVNLMPYSLYKKLGGYDEELIKTRRTV